MKFLILALVLAAATHASADQLVKGSATHFNFTTEADTLGAAEAAMWQNAFQFCRSQLGDAAITIRTSKVHNVMNHLTSAATSSAQFKCVIAGQS